METDSTTSILADKLIAIVEEETAIHPVTLDMTLRGMGVDSLDFICIYNAVCEQLGPISRARAAQMNANTSVRDILEAIGT